MPINKTSDILQQREEEFHNEKALFDFSRMLHAPIIKRV